MFDKTEESTDETAAVVQQEVQSFGDAEVETVQKVLATIDRSADARVRDGFNEMNFTLGVINCLVVSHVFSVHPQHFWLLYLIEYVYLIPKRFYADYHAKPLCRALYFLDYCWVMNMIGSTALIAFSLNTSLSTEIRKQVCGTLLGVSCGPLLGATAVLPFVAVVFHSNNTMTSLFIHLFPPMLAYTFLWHGEEVQQAWPNTFRLDYADGTSFFPESGVFFVPGSGIGSIAGNCMALYMLWFIPYVSWMVLIGIDLPKKNRKDKDGVIITPCYDTVFHNTVRKGLYAKFAKVAWGQPMSISQHHVDNDDYEVGAFLVYMAAHALSIYLATLVLASSCFFDKRIHMALIAVLAVICIYRGSKRYTYWATSVYGKVIRKEFGGVVNETNKQQ